MKVRKSKKVTALQLCTILLLVFIIAQILRITLYSYATFYQTLNSDSASDILQAELAASQGHLIFADNWYVSTELRVIGINIIPTILFYFGLSYRMIWALTCGISAILITGSVYIAMRMLRVERFESLLASLLILLPTSELAEFLYIYPVYQMFLVMFLFLIAFLTELIATNTSKWQILLLGMLVSFVCGICGPRLIIQGMVPVLLFLLYRILRKHVRDDISIALIKDTAKQYQSVIWCAVSMLVGYLIYEFILSNKYGHGSAGLAIASIQEISQNLLRLPEALLLLYGLPYHPGSIGTEVAFMIQILFIFISYACYVWLLFSRNRLDTRKSISVKITTTLVVFSFLLVALMHTLDGVGPTWRYWAFGTFPMLIIIPIALSNWKRRSVRYLLTIAGCVLVFAYPSYHDAVKISKELQVPFNPPAYLSFLEENHFEFGEATFWNANKNTVFSDGEIRIKPVFNDEKLSFFAWLTHQDYRNREPEFLLLTQEEYQYRQQNGWETPYQPVFSDEGYLVFAKSGPALP